MARRRLLANRSKALAVQHFVSGALRPLRPLREPAFFGQPARRFRAKDAEHAKNLADGTTQAVGQPLEGVGGAAFYLWSFAFFAPLARTRLFIKDRSIFLSCPCFRQNPRYYERSA